MATFRLTAAPKFPKDSTVFAYPKALWAGGPPVDGDIPRAPAVASDTVDERGYASLGGLTPGATYYAGGEVNGAWRWIVFSLPESREGGGGGISPEELAAIEGLVAAETLARETAVVALNAAIAELAAKSGLDAAAFDARLLSKGVVTALRAPPKNASGSIKLDCSKGDVFPLTLTGDITLERPINLPASIVREGYIEVVATGDHGINLGEGLSWYSGGEPALNGGSPTAENRLMLVTDDLVNFVVLNLSELPEDLVRVALEGRITGGLVAFNGTGYETIDPTTVGLDEAAVTALVAALAVTADAPLSIATAGLGSATAENPVVAAFADNTGDGLLLDLRTQILLKAFPHLKPHANVEANTTAVVDTIYPITKPGVILTMPTGAIAASPRPIVVQNLSGGAIKLKGIWTAGGSVETIELTDAETVLYLSGDETEAPPWLAILVGRTLAQLEATIARVVASTWSPTGLSTGAKMEEAKGLTEPNTLAARLEAAGARVALHGAIQVKAGETAEAGDVLFTLPSGKRPAKTVWTFLFSITGNVAVPVKVEPTNGKVKLLGSSLAAATQLALEPASIPLT